MVQPAPMSAKLIALPKRPPTPPRGSTAGFESSSSLEDASGLEDSSTFATIEIKSLASKIPVQLPSAITPESPSDSPAQSISSRKKVGFSVQEFSLLSEGQTSRPASAERKPTKSILKPGNIYEVDTKTSAPHKYPNFATMLESMCKQLAGRDRNSKMDAYITLCGALKASDNVPDLRALEEKMGLLLQFIERDLTAKGTNGSADNALTKEALLLLASFLYKPSIAKLLHDDFTSHFVEHVIKVFEGSGMSKEVVNKMMFVLAQQSFSAKVMSSERITRLMKAIRNIENNVKGKSITVQTLNIYRTLLGQSKASFVGNLEWLGYLFECLQSNFPDVRSAAIAFGMDAAKTLGYDSKVSKAVADLTNAEAGGCFYAQLLSKNLKKLVKESSDCAQVPQVWTVVVLFFRARPRQLEQWAYLQLWIETLQDCFNSSDANTKIAANMAWNHFVYAIRPDEKVSQRMIKALPGPFTHQFKRKEVRKPSSRFRKAILGNFHNLLYYSFAPNPTSARLDKFWDEYVVKIMKESFIPSSPTQISDGDRMDVNDACLVLIGLIDSRTSMTWDEARVMRNEFVEAKELPVLDCKWIRKNSFRIFPLLTAIAECSFGDLSSPSQAVTQLWEAYLRSVASAAGKEIQISNDTMACVASIFSWLYTIWQKGSRWFQESLSLDRTEFLASFEAITIAMIKILGHLPLTEKQLLSPHLGGFSPITTPTHQNKRLRGDKRSPLQHLIVLFTIDSPDLIYDARFLEMLCRVLTPFVELRESSKAQLELVRNLLQLLSPHGTEACKAIWQVLAEFASRAVGSRDTGSENSSSNDQPPGANYRDNLTILETGIEMSPSDASSGWRDLFIALKNSAELDAGHPGVAIAVIEPLAETLKEKLFTSSLPPSASSLVYCHILLSNAKYPKDRQALDAALRRLWGTASGVQKNSFDPYMHLYGYSCQCLQKSYSLFDAERTKEYCNVLSAVTDLLKRCPDTLAIAALAKLQDGIACWVLDVSVKFKGIKDPLSQIVATLWSKVCSLISNCQVDPPRKLKDLETVISAGLQSTHVSIVNSAISMWNHAFGGYDKGFDYPTKVKDALSRLRPQVPELLLPSFPESLTSDAPIDQHQFMSAFDTQDYTNIPSSSRTDMYLKKQRIPDFSPMTNRTKFPIVVLPSSFMSTKRSREETPQHGQKRAKTKSTKSKHDDSQIQFQAIDSSPIGDTTYELELLTERQKEVKERQRTDANMFPDLRSSPISKGKSAQKKILNTELPLHRSSESPPEASTNGERQTTPRLPNHNDFDEYIPSSPTPSRALPHVNYDAGPSSSPPEYSAKDEPMAYPTSEEFNAISWPNRILQTNPDEQSDLANWAPKAGEMSPILGAILPSSPVDQAASPLCDALDESERAPPATEQVPSELHVDGFADVGIADLQGSPSLKELYKQQPLAKSADKESLANVTDQPQLPEIQEDQEMVQAPTPTHDIRSPATPPHNVEVFVDAVAIPSSDKKSADDVFEDAVSTPQLIARQFRAEDKHISSPMSDFDQSSLLRAIEEADKTVQRDLTVSAAESKGGAEAELRSSALLTNGKDTSHIKSLPASHFGLGNNKDSNTNARSTKALQSSSNPTVIPDTPRIIQPLAQIVEVDGKEKIVLGDEEFDPEDTIIVEFPVSGIRRKGIRGRRSGASQKRKSDQFDVTEDAVPDNQEAIPQEATTVDQAPPRKKRGRQGRPSRASQVSQVESQESESLQNSLMNLDNGSSIHSDSPAFSQGDITTSSIKYFANNSFTSSMGVEKEVNHEALNVSAGLKHLAVEKAPQQSVNTVSADVVSRSKGKAASSNDSIIEETTLPETSTPAQSTTPIGRITKQSLSKVTDEGLIDPGSHMDELSLNPATPPAKHEAAAQPSINNDTTVVSTSPVPTPASTKRRVKSLKIYTKTGTTAKDRLDKNKIRKPSISPASSMSARYGSASSPNVAKTTKEKSTPSGSRSASTSGKRVLRTADRKIAEGVTLDEVDSPFTPSRRRTRLSGSQGASQTPSQRKKNADLEVIEGANLVETDSPGQRDTPSGRKTRSSTVGVVEAKQIQGREHSAQSSSSSSNVIQVTAEEARSQTPQQPAISEGASEIPPAEESNDVPTVEHATEDLRRLIETLSRRVWPNEEKSHLEELMFDAKNALYSKREFAR